MSPRISFPEQMSFFRENSEKLEIDDAFRHIYRPESIVFIFNNQGPVVQNFISLTLSLYPQFVNYISTSKANTLLLFVEKIVRILCIAKDSHFFPKKKKNCTCNIAIYNFNESAIVNYLLPTPTPDHKITFSAFEANPFLVQAYGIWCTSPTFSVIVNFISSKVSSDTVNRNKYHDHE